MSLSGARLAEAPWGELVQVLDGRVAQVDGQLVLSLDGSDVNSDEAFAGAEAYERAGNLEQAERLYDLAARLDKVDPVIPFNLGNVLDELGRERDAEIAYRQAIARDPKFPDAWFNLGVLQEKIGRRMKRSGATREPSRCAFLCRHARDGEPALLRKRGSERNHAPASGRGGYRSGSKCRHRYWWVPHSEGNEDRIPLAASGRRSEEFRRSIGNFGPMAEQPRRRP